MIQVAISHKMYNEKQAEKTFDMSQYFIHSHKSEFDQKKKKMPCEDVLYHNIYKVASSRRFDSMFFLLLALLALLLFQPLKRFQVELT